MAEEQSTVTGPKATEDYPRLVRVQEGRVFAGVCTGLGRYMGVDPVILRVGFAVLVLANGQGLLYLAAYLLMPSAPQVSSPVEQVLRRRFDADTALALLGGLLLVFTLVTTGGRLFSGNALAGVTVLALVLLTAHARKVDLAQVVRSMPERLQGHPMTASAPPQSVPSQGPGPVSLVKTAPGAAPPHGDDLRYEEMVDLAVLSERYRQAPAEDAQAGAGDGPGPRCERHGSHSRLTSLTLLGALIAGAAMIPVAVNGDYGIYGGHLVAAPALAVIGLGLLVGGWAGRPRGLATVGTMLTLGLLTSTAVAETPSDTRFGGVEWRPADAPRTEQTYRLGVGDGRLDLTALPLAPGGRVRINAELTAGKLTITVPQQARVELDGRVTLGDLTVDGRITSGPLAQVSRVLEPRTAPGDGDQPPVIELRVRARVGDVEVRHG